MEVASFLSCSRISKNFGWTYERLKYLPQIFSLSCSVCIRQTAYTMLLLYTGDAAHITRRPSTRKKGETTCPNLIATAINLLISTRVHRLRYRTTTKRE